MSWIDVRDAVETTLLAALAAVFLVGGIWVITKSAEARQICESRGGVWVSGPGECARPLDAP